MHPIDDFYLTFQEAHLAAAPLTVSSKRLEAVEFTLPLLRSAVVIIYKRPAQNAALPFSNVKVGKVILPKLISTYSYGNEPFIFSRKISSQGHRKVGIEF